MKRVLTLSVVSAALLAGCAGDRAGPVSDRVADRTTVDRPTLAMIGGATSDRLLLNAAARAHTTELASTDPRTTAASTTASTGLPTRRPRNDSEEVGASIGSHSWKVNRDPKNGMGELCAIQNYYTAPKATR